MNIGLVTSFLIGGIFLVAILAFNIQVQSTSQELTLSTINQNSLNDIVEVITNDFNRIGFNTGIATPFTTIDSDDILFQGDVFDGDSYGVTNIRYEFDTTDPVTSTSNPNDYYLVRTGPTGTSTYGTTKFPAVYFTVNYYTATGSTTTDKASVKKIEVELMVETGEAYSLNGTVKEYPRSVWKRIFVPNNINLPY